MDRFATGGRLPPDLLCFLNQGPNIRSLQFPYGCIGIEIAIGAALAAEGDVEIKTINSH
jgi:hypothetical protein